MGFFKFTAWYIGALVSMVFLETMLENPFIISFIVAGVIAFLAGKDE